jgi:hypothetical protein
MEEYSEKNSKNNEKKESVTQHQQNHTERKVITPQRIWTSLNLVLHVYLRLILSIYVHSDGTSNIWQMRHQHYYFWYKVLLMCCGCLISSLLSLTVSWERVVTSRNTKRIKHFKKTNCTKSPVNTLQFSVLIVPFPRVWWEEGMVARQVKLVDAEQFMPSELVVWSPN